MALGHWLKDYIGPHSGGSGGGGAKPLIVNIVDGEGEGEVSGSSLDRTWQEIHDAFPNVILRQVTSGIGGECEKFYSVINVREAGGLDRTTYTVDSFQSSTAGLTIYITYDPNGYPSNS